MGTCYVRGMMDGGTSSAGPEEMALGLLCIAGRGEGQAHSVNAADCLVTPEII